MLVQLLMGGRSGSVTARIASSRWVCHRASERHLDSDATPVCGRRSACTQEDQADLANCATLEPPEQTAPANLRLVDALVDDEELPLDISVAADGDEHGKHLCPLLLAELANEAATATNGGAGSPRERALQAVTLGTPPGDGECGDTRAAQVLDDMPHHCECGNASDDHLAMSASTHAGALRS
jgi:hypothetical protein